MEVLDMFRSLGCIAFASFARFLSYSLLVALVLLGKSDLTHRPDDKRVASNSVVPCPLCLHLSSRAAEPPSSPGSDRPGSFPEREGKKQKALSVSEKGIRTSHLLTIERARSC